MKIRSKHIGSDYSANGCSECFLAYSKQKSGWRICWIEVDEYYAAYPDTEVEVTCPPIVEWPVEIRLEGFEQFPKLYGEVLNVAKEFVPKIDIAVKEFERTLACIDL